MFFKIYVSEIRSRKLEVIRKLEIRRNVECRPTRDCGLWTCGRGSAGVLQILSSAFILGQHVKVNICHHHFLWQSLLTPS